MKNYCAFTFDVEEWFQVENLRNAINKEDWTKFKSTVTKNTQRILDILVEYDLKVTFFILGWVAEKKSNLVRAIYNQGHEIASHGSGHDLTYSLSDQQLQRDIQNSKSFLEDITGTEVTGYRAPNFSVDERLIMILQNLGFRYDSSYNPFKLNKRYGSIHLPEQSGKNIYKLSDSFYEIPLSTVSSFGKHIPMAGGAYFRLFPGIVFNSMVKYKILKDGFYNFYLHPWEFEPDQPRVKNIPLNYKIRHYTGLEKTGKKLKNLIILLKSIGCEFITLSEYVRHYEMEHVRR
jgi:polysaccharide deacetylase family protein (PEP-CTERM system associated)